MAIDCNGIDPPFFVPSKTLDPKQPAQPWQVIGRFVKFQTPDHKRWWESMSPVIGAHLTGTKYSVGAQYRHLLMLQYIILPSLGPFPNASRTNLQWPSCLPGNGEPWEISVNYQRNGKSKFRLAVEPSGPLAGTLQDPINECAARQLMIALQSIQPDINFTLLDTLEGSLTLSNQDARQHWDVLAPQRVRSQTVVALDLGETRLTLKPYLVPLVRSLATATVPTRIMLDSARGHWGAGPMGPGLGLIDEFLSANTHPLIEARGFLSFDCTTPETSRVKIYVGAEIHSFETLEAFWTLGGRLRGEEMEKGFEMVRTVWDLVSSYPLPSGEHRNGVVLSFNWEVAPDAPVPVPKAYFLMVDYHDRYATATLDQLFLQLGWEDHVETHQGIQDEAYPKRDFETSSQIYTWIALAYTEKAGPYVTVYSNPATVC